MGEQESNTIEAEKGRTLLVVVALLLAIYGTSLALGFLVDAGLPTLVMLVTGLGLVVVLSRWLPSVWVGVLVGAMSFSLPVLQVNDFGVGHGEPVELAALVSAWIAVGGLGGAAINGAERTGRPRLKRVVRATSWLLLAGGVVGVGIGCWEGLAASTPGRLGQMLEFRLVAETGDPGLTEESVSDAVGTGQAPRGYAWMKISPEEGKELLAKSAIIRHQTPEAGYPNAIQHFVLVADDHPYALTHRPERNAWGVKAVRRVWDTERWEGMIYVGVSLRLDKAGAAQLREVSRACINRQLAIVVDGWVRAAPTVQSTLSTDLELTKSFATTGRNATSEQQIADARQWVEDLHVILKQKGE